MGEPRTDRHAKSGFAVLEWLRRKRRRRKTDAMPPAPEMSEFDLETLRVVQPYTMTSTARLQALIKATRYLAKYRIPGAIVECGVWRGGSMLTVARTLLDCGDVARELYLFDTFEGMSEPGPRDIRRADGATARYTLDEGGEREWLSVGVEQVNRTMALCSYERERLHYVVGRVEDTVPAAAPGEIALLRLDTDWYESTRHELVHLYPRLVPGGVLIIDDYGWWEGARQAVDEYFVAGGPRMLLNIIDDTGRIGVKL